MKKKQSIFLITAILVLAYPSIVHAKFGCHLIGKISNINDNETSVSFTFSGDAKIITAKFQKNTKVENINVIVGSSGTFSKAIQVVKRNIPSNFGKDISFTDFVEEVKIISKENHLAQIGLGNGECKFTYSAQEGVIQAEGVGGFINNETKSREFFKKMREKTKKEIGVY